MPLTIEIPTDAAPAAAAEYGALAGFVGLGLAAGAAGAVATQRGLQGWYQGLEKPGFTPPNAIFAPVWTTLYGLIGVAGWRMWQRREDPRARQLLGLWGAQLALNAAWSPLFFGARKPGVALADIALLWGTIGAFTIGAAKVDKVAAAAFVPYWAWVTFASALNEEIWRKN